MNKKYIILIIAIFSVLTIYIFQGLKKEFAAEQYICAIDNLPFTYNGVFYPEHQRCFLWNNPATTTTPTTTTTPPAATTPPATTPASTAPAPTSSAAAHIPESPGSIVEQYIVSAISNYRNTSKQVVLKDQSLTSVPSIFQYSVYNNDIKSGSGTLCTYYPGLGSVANNYEPPNTTITVKPNYNSSDTCSPTM